MIGIVIYLDYNELISNASLVLLRPTRPKFSLPVEADKLQEQLQLWLLYVIAGFSLQVNNYFVPQYFIPKILIQVSLMELDSLPFTPTVTELLVPVRFGGLMVMLELQNNTVVTKSNRVNLRH